ncbi:MAG: hypothetical protein AAGC56_01380 [Pseudomonadota bacterium]
MQNWTAVAIDFVIVVVGVFIGIQVANGNEARAAAAYERELLARLQVEIERNRTTTTERYAYLNTVYRAGRRTIAYLNDDAVCTDTCWGLVADAFYASQWRNLAPYRTAYDELSRRGLPRNAEIKRAVDDYFLLYEEIMLVMEELPTYRAVARSIIPSDVQDHLWRECHRVDRGRQFLAEECPPGADAEASRAILERLRRRPDAQLSLTYWMSTIALIKPTLADQNAAAEDVLATIENELGKD